MSEHTSTGGSRSLLQSLREAAERGEHLLSKGVPWDSEYATVWEDLVETFVKMTDRGYKPTAAIRPRVYGRSEWERMMAMLGYQEAPSCGPRGPKADKVWLDEIAYGMHTQSPLLNLCIDRVSR